MSFILQGKLVNQMNFQIFSKTFAIKHQNKVNLDRQSVRPLDPGDILVGSLGSTSGYVEAFFCNKKKAQEDTGYLSERSAPKEEVGIQQALTSSSEGQQPVCVKQFLVKIIIFKILIFFLIIKELQSGVKALNLRYKRYHFEYQLFYTQLI